MSLSPVKKRSKIEMDFCPICYSENIKKCCGEFQRNNIVIPYLEWYYCPDCKEKFYDINAASAIEDYR
ncbi:MAG TPA: hypothetical protein PKY81_02585 [bacterium]|nr:hypothetical protein [bacterium]